jgi:hypothetical protein
LTRGTWISIPWTSNIRMVVSLNEPRGPLFRSFDDRAAGAVNVPVTTEDRSAARE